MRKKKYQIGIDPDNDKSGIAVWNTETQEFELIESLNFWATLVLLKEGRCSQKTIKGYRSQDANVIIEAGWLNKKSNWHKMQGAAIREKVAQNVGKNMQIGKLFQDYCRRYGIEYEIRKPIGSKDVTRTFFQQLTGWKGSTNQDNRDAAMLVFKS